MTKLTSTNRSCKLVALVLFFTSLFVLPQDAKSQGPAGMPDVSGVWSLFDPVNHIEMGKFDVTLVPTGIRLSAIAGVEFPNPDIRDWAGDFVWHAPDPAHPHDGMLSNDGKSLYFFTGDFVLGHNKIGIHREPVQTFRGWRISIESEETLIAAVKRSDPEAVAGIIKSSPEFINKIHDGTTAMHEAVTANNEEVMANLLKAGGNADTKASNGRTVLEESILSGNHGITQVILSNSGVLAISDATLEKAVNNKNNTIVMSLFDHGADPKKSLPMIEKSDNPVLFKEVAKKYDLFVDHSIFESAAKGNRSAMCTAILECKVNHGAAMTTACQLKRRDLIVEILPYGESPDNARVYAEETNDKELLILSMTHGADPGWALLYAIKVKDDALAAQTVNRFGADPTKAMNHIVGNNNLAGLETLLKLGADPNVKMEYVSEAGLDDDLRVLLAHGGDANLGTNKAAYREHWSTVRILVLEGGASPDPAMRHTVNKQHLETLKFLLDQGADANVRSYMYESVNYQNKEMIAMLLENGADANGGMEAAIKLQDLDIVTMLLDGGAKANDPKYMKTVAEQKNIPLMSLLVDRGADPNDAMSTCCKQGQTDAVKMLLDKGADGASEGLLASCSGLNDTVLVGYLLDAGANPEEGILHAVTGNAPDVVVQLGEAGVDLTEKGHLDVAVYDGHADVVAVLIDAGSDPTLIANMTTGDTYLHVAADRKYFEVAELLLKSGVDQHKTNHQGETALHLAVSGPVRHMELVALLVREGDCDVNAVNNKGKSILQEAQGSKIKKFLKSEGAVKKPNK